MNDEEMHQKIIDAIPWRCFHCDFITTNRAEAAAHFGDEDDTSEFTPLCKWWTSLSLDEKCLALQDTIQQLNEERDAAERMLTKIEGLEYQANSLVGAIQSFKPFRDNNCRTVYDVFCLYDSMEGRALAAEEKVKC
jgi:hypothetical protein